MNEMASVPQIPLPPAPPPAERVIFTGKRLEFRRLATRGAILEFFTLGFYRFWLNTDIRRHLWSHTVVEGDAPEYTGRARELLIGFLVAMAILIPIYLAYFLISLEAERLQAFASVPLLLFTYLFGQFAIYRARRYRLSRTVWRGVRLWMTGSGWAYAFRAGAWGVLTVVTLGLALPWSHAALERYKMRHSHYGSVQGSFVGRGSVFFKRAWWLWLLTPTAILIIPIPFLYGAYRSIQWRWWLEGIRFGGVAVQSSLRRGALIGLYWGVIGWSILASTIFGLYMSGLSAAFYALKGDGAAPTKGIERLERGLEATFSNPLFVTLMIVGYLLMIVAINVALRLYLTRDMWQRVVSSVTVTGLDSVRDVAARGELAGSLGEGLADGLDVGGF